MSEILRDVMAAELTGLKTAAEKVVVIHEGVFNARGSQRRRDLRLPDALGEPEAARPLHKMFFDVIRQPDDLFVTIMRGYRNQHRLVKSASYHFDLAAFNEVLQTL